MGLSGSLVVDFDQKSIEHRLQQDTSGAVQRRRIRHRHHAARPRHRGQTRRFPPHEFVSAGPTYVGYVVSFITIGVAWIAHSAITAELTKVDAVFFRLNLLLLLFVVFLPFPTRMIIDGFGDREAERVAVTVFGFTLLLIRLMSMALDRYAQTEGPLPRRRDRRRTRAGPQQVPERSAPLLGRHRCGPRATGYRGSGVLRDRALSGDPLAPRRAHAQTPAHGIPMNTCRRR